MFCLVVLLSIYFISNIWMKWTASPLIISLNSKSTSIRDLPFPGNIRWNIQYFGLSFPSFRSTTKRLKSFKNLKYSHFIAIKAVTLCDMNTVKYSAIHQYEEGSQEHFVVKSLCRQDYFNYFGDASSVQSATWPIFRKTILEVNRFSFILLISI